MKKKILTILTAIFIACGLMLSITACGGSSPTDDTQDATIIMGKVVEKIDSVSEMFFNTITNTSEPTGVVPMNKTTSSARGVATTFSTNNIPSDISFSQVSADDTLVRQLYINYPYNIANYILQNTTKAHKLYNNKYKVGQTVYGVASKTISDEINDIFADSSIGSPTLAVNIQKGKNYISFTADWDWRNDAVEELAPRYNSVVMNNGKVEYDSKTKEIERIEMTWFWNGVNGDFMASVMDFKTNKFYFLEGWRDSIWEGWETKESLANVFNSGELTYDKLCDYPYTGIYVVESNITDDVNDLQFKALRKEDSDINSVGGSVADSQNKQAEFSNFYNQVYQQVKGVKMRDIEDKISLINATEVNYMNDASIYGLNKTKCVTHYEGIEFLFIDYDNLQRIFNSIENDNKIKQNENALSLIKNAKKCLANIKQSYIGELGEYEGKTYTLEPVLNNQTKIETWRIWAEDFSYLLSDGESVITFKLQKGELVNVSDDVKEEVVIDGMTFTLNEDRKSYALSQYTPSIQEGKVNLVIPATCENKPVTRIKDSAFRNVQNITFESIEIPASVNYIGRNNIDNLEKVNFLGTVNQWAQCEFGMGGFFALGGDLYINGELLTSANITATRINDWAFYNCTSLTNITLSDNLEYVGTNSFVKTSLVGSVYDNAYYIGTPSNPYKILLRATSKNITSVRLHDNTEIVSGFAFSGCSSLEEVQLNEKLTKIGYSSFEHCSALRELFIPSSVKVFSAMILGEYRREEPITFIFETNYGWCKSSTEENSTLTDANIYNMFEERISQELMQNMQPYWYICIK